MGRVPSPPRDGVAGAGADTPGLGSPLPLTRAPTGSVGQAGGCREEKHKGLVGAAWGPGPRGQPGCLQPAPEQVTPLSSPDTQGRGRASGPWSRRPQVEGGSSKAGTAPRLPHNHNLFFPLRIRSRGQRRSSGQLPAGLHNGLGGILQTAGRFLRADIRASSGPQPGL